MAASSDFLPFATGSGANVTDQADWEADSTVANGFSSGLAPSAKFNKALRQATFGAAALAGWIASQLGAPVLDDGVLSNFETQIGSALAAFLANGGYTPAQAMGGISGLKIGSVGVSNYTSSISAASLTLRNASGSPHVLTNFIATGNINSSGANGLDAGSLAASTFYNVWAIYNPTTSGSAVLYSLSATAPTLPSGYTYYLRLGSVLTDGTASKYLIPTLQVGRKVQYVTTAGSNLTALPAMASGLASAWTAVSTTGFVSPTAVSIRLQLQSYYGGNSAQSAVAPNATYATTNVATANVPPILLNPASSSTSWSVIGEFILETSNIYWWATSSSSQSLHCFGWEENL